mgnify:CR=1 FL=1
MSKRKGEEFVLNPTKAVKAVTQSAFMKEFGEFINRGSIVDLAIGVAVGGAFTTIVKSLVDDIIMPVAGLIAGGVDLTKLSIDVPNLFGADNGVHIAYGNFLQSIINFLIVAFTVFVIVKFLNRLNADAKAKLEKEAAELAAQEGKKDLKAAGNKKEKLKKTT